MFIIDDNFIDNENIINDPNRDRKKIVLNNVIITFPSNYKLPNPFCCPVCEYPMREQNDAASYEEDKCCNFCQTFFAKKNKEKWNSGWRPEKKEIEQVMLSIGMNI